MNEKTFSDQIPVSYQNCYLSCPGCHNTHAFHCNLVQLGTYLVCFRGVCTGDRGSCRYSLSCPDPQMTTGSLHWSIWLSWPVVPGLVEMWLLQGLVGVHVADLLVQAVVVVWVVVVAHVVAVVLVLAAVVLIWAVAVLFIEAPQVTAVVVQAQSCHYYLWILKHLCPVTYFTGC